MSARATATSPAEAPGKLDERRGVRLTPRATILGAERTILPQTFAAAGRTYEEPKLVLFSGAVESACGFAQAAFLQRVTGGHPFKVTFPASVYWPTTT